METARRRRQLPDVVSAQPNRGIDTPRVRRDPPASLTGTPVQTMLRPVIRETPDQQRFLLTVNGEIQEAHGPYEKVLEQYDAEVLRVARLSRDQARTVTLADHTGKLLRVAHAPVFTEKEVVSCAQTNENGATRHRTSPQG